MDKALNILLIEDNPGDALIIEELLNEEELEYKLVHRETLKQGIEAYESQYFDVILLDLGLPDAFDMYAIEVMYEKSRETPIIVITGLNDENAGIKAMKLGAQNYLVKGKMNSRLIAESIWYSIERNEHLKKIRKKEQELAEKNEQLNDLNQSKDRLLSILSHDLRGPVQSANSLLELLVSNYEDFDDKEKKDMITACFKSIYSTSELLETILAWARSQSKKIEKNAVELSLCQLFDESVEPLLTAAGNKQIQIINTADNDAVIFADKQMVSTVIRNLVSNAIKFTNVNGRITFGAKSVSNHMVQFYVEDNGVGIEPSKLNTIFYDDKSASTTGTLDEKGTGLGLNLCKDFIEKSNGRIWIQSEHGKGTIVNVELPATAKK